MTFPVVTASLSPSLVSVYEGESESGVSRHLIVDGQQRLTTLMLLMCALRDRQTERDPDDKKTQMEFVSNFTMNGDDYHRIFHTDPDDRETYIRLSFGKAEDVQEFRLKPKDLLGQGYKFFWEQMGSITDLTRLRRVISESLRLVRIELEGENPYAIFESLNVNHTPLTQADLIRNYFFMHAKSSDHRMMYASYWKPMEETLTDQQDKPKRGRSKDYLSEFIRHVLMRNGEVIDTRSVYTELKNSIEQTNQEAVQSKTIIEHLAELHRLSELYGYLVWPEREPNVEISKRMKRLNQLQVSTAYPVLLNVYQAHKEGKLSTAQVIEFLDTLLNFIIRRLVCGVATHGLNKMFCKFAADAKGVDFEPSFVKRFLSDRKYKYPTDEKFKQALQETNIYTGGSDKLARVVLAYLEESFQHKEPVDLSLNNIEIEHVMPQTLSDWWTTHLGDDYKEVHADYCHVLGNLTLTGKNQELGNKPYPEKQAKMADSHFELNRHFLSVSAWTKDSIESRSKILADLAIKVWPSFSDTQAESQIEIRMRGKSPAALSILGWRAEVKKWSALVPLMVDKLLELDPDRYDAIAARFHRYIRPERGKWTQARKLQNNRAWIRTNWPSQEAVRFCEDLADAFDFSDKDWNIEFIEECDETAETEQLQSIATS